jgi:hypothetical protein
MLSTFPPSVNERAADPAHGIPSKIQYLNLAAMRKLLDAWADEYYERQDRAERANRKALPEPPRDPQMEARIAKGFAELAEKLKRGLSG